MKLAEAALIQSTLLPYLSPFNLFEGLEKARWRVVRKALQSSHLMVYYDICCRAPLKVKFVFTDTACAHFHESGNCLPDLCPPPDNPLSSHKFAVTLYKRPGQRALREETQKHLGISNCIRFNI